jgi:hypothetical protein
MAETPRRPIYQSGVGAFRLPPRLVLVTLWIVSIILVTMQPMHASTLWHFVNKNSNHHRHIDWTFLLSQGFSKNRFMVAWAGPPCWRHHDPTRLPAGWMCCRDRIFQGGIVTETKQWVDSTSRHRGFSSTYWDKPRQRPYCWISRCDTMGGRGVLVNPSSVGRNTTQRLSKKISYLDGQEKALTV